MSYWFDIIRHKSDNQGYILNIFNYKKIQELVSECELLIRKYDLNFKLPKLILRYDKRSIIDAAIKENGREWFLTVNKKIITTKTLKYSILHECVHYWIGKDFYLGSDYFTSPESCPYNSNIKCFQISKVCSCRKKLYCLLFQKTKLDPNIEPSITDALNKYYSFEDVIVNYTAMKILPNEVKLNYTINQFEEDIQFSLEPYMPKLQLALDYLFKNYDLK